MQYRNRFKKVIVFLAYSLFASQAPGGQNLYVSPQGMNSSSGSIHAPLKSLWRALTLARPGDTIILRGGVYNMGEVLIERRKGMGGKAGQYLTIKAFEGEEPILRGNKRRLIIQADYVRIEGLHFIMPWRCEAFGRGLQIVNNIFTGPQPKYGAIEAGGQDILIAGNLIHYNDSEGNTRDHGIYVHRGQRITIKDNKIISAKGYGIHIYDEHKSSNPAEWTRRPFAMRGYVIEGNVVVGSQMRSGMIIAKGRGGNNIILENMVVRNNVFMNNAEFGLLIREGKNITVLNNTFYLNRLACMLIREPSEGLKPASDIKIQNNIFVTRSGRPHVGKRSTGDNIVLENNLYDSKPFLGRITDAKAIVGDPEFVDVAANDFHLQPSSPAIDSGVDVGLPYSGSAPDLGAFEFGSLLQQSREVRHRGDMNEGTKDISISNGASQQNEQITLQAFVVGHSAILDWKSASPDQDELEFEVERSVDKVNFESIASINNEREGAEQQSYQYVDEDLNNGQYYYRIKQLTSEGAVEYSPIAEVTISAP